ncbi:MAG: hypothetical protein LCH81_17440 [Bacteroidetes bacterium]|nr:hypothetical protein [Bacteroidota bacterium]
MKNTLLLPLLLFLSALGAHAQSAAPRDTSGVRVIRPGLEISGETIICPGSLTALKVEGKYATYQWSTGHQTPNLTVYKPGTYSVTVTTSGGCELTGSVTVRYNPNPCL